MKAPFTTKLLFLGISLAICLNACDSNQTTNLSLPEPKGVLAFVSTRDGNSEIYTYDFVNGETQRMTENIHLDFHPSFSKDGKTIFFYSKRNGNADLFKISPDSGEFVQITNHPMNETLPAPSPSGKEILFVSDRDSLSRNIFLLKLDPNETEQITQNSMYEESPSWHPNGESILFTRVLREVGDTSHSSNGEIMLHNFKTKETRRLLHKKGFDSGAKFSPDGQKIAFYGEVEGIFDLYLMDANGENLINLTQDSTEAYSPSWSPDGKWLAYTSGNHENYEIWIINIESKERRRITQSPGRDEGPAWGILTKKQADNE